jgi:hypothetical protein
VAPVDIYGGTAAAQQTSARRKIICETPRVNSHHFTCYHLVLFIDPGRRSVGEDRSYKKVQRLLYIGGIWA